jgi:hypothetical protein
MTKTVSNGCWNSLKFEKTGTEDCNAIDNLRQVKLLFTNSVNDGFYRHIATQSTQSIADACLAGMAYQCVLIAWQHQPCRLTSVPPAVKSCFLSSFTIERRQVWRNLREGTSSIAALAQD